MEEKRENGLGVDDAILDIVRDQKPRRTLLRRGLPQASELENLDPQTIQEITDDNFYAVSQKTGRIVKLKPVERAQGHGLFNDEGLPRTLGRNLHTASVIAKRRAK